MWKTAAALLAGFALSTGSQDAASRCDLAATIAAGAGCQRALMDRNLKLNDLVTVGTHNSYKTPPPDAILPLVRAEAPGRADELDSGHRPLSEQLDVGARQLEFDVYYDPEGGRFLHPTGLAAGLTVGAARRAALTEPGFKVMHVQDVDLLSFCVNLRACLGAVRRWSLGHPDHAPIFLMFNAKTDPTQAPGGVDALSFDAAASDALDRGVRAVFPLRALITPNDVRSRYPRLREAVIHGAWPPLGQARGKVLFALDVDAPKIAVYRGKRRSLEGGMFFVNTDERSPTAAYLTLNDSLEEAERIRNGVAAGFIVRTRADSGTLEAWGNGTRRRDAALASGARFISTDYLSPEPRLHNDYQVRLPGGAAVLCNPVRVAPRCAGLAVETAAPASRAYLTPQVAPDGVRILPPPPAPRGPLAVADRQVFAATRRLKGSPRWKLATADVDTDAFEHFACALGARLTARTAPALTRLLDGADTSGVVDPVKRLYRTPRPYLGSEAPICQARTAHLAGNGDYPSGHAANGWMEALILAELAPDRATEILARGRAFGESRLICGAHSLSAVEAGWLAGAAATAALHGSAEFRADLEAARREMPTVRRSSPAPDAAACRAEAAALAKAAY